MRKQYNTQQEQMFAALCVYVLWTHMHMYCFLLRCGGDGGSTLLLDTCDGCIVKGIHQHKHLDDAAVALEETYSTVGNAAAALIYAKATYM